MGNLDTFMIREYSIFGTIRSEIFFAIELTGLERIQEN